MKIIQQKEALNLFENNRLYRGLDKNNDNHNLIGLRYLMLINDIAKLRGYRLYSIFEIMGIKTRDDMDEILSYLLSNIEVLSKIKIDQKSSKTRSPRKSKNRRVTAEALRKKTYHPKR